MKRWLIRLGLLAVIGLLIAAFVVIRGWNGAGPAQASISVVIKDGSSLGQAATQLEQAGAISSASRFKLFARLFGSTAPIRAGEYQLPVGASAAEILKQLQSGKTLQRLITIPEGMPSILVYEKLMAEPLLTGPLASPAEGTILPDSYSFERGEPRAAVLERMQLAMNRAVDEAWAKRGPGVAVANKAELVALAAIVEKETAVAAERPVVAAVYSNRLRIGMKLQADPTVIYPITKGKPLGRRIRRSELDALNGYNTYAMAGLPAGPIANPGRAALNATANPPPSDYLFFVANGQGGHVFARTLAEHNANVARWFAIRRNRGEL
jgi:UPF0755 protein